MNALRYCCFVVLILALMPCAVAEAPFDYLSDVYDDLAVSHVQGWGKLGINTATKPPDGRPASPLKIGAKTYEKGLGHHAAGEMVFKLPAGEYTHFEAVVGIHGQGGGKGSVVFQVWLDGKKRFDSGVRSDSDEAMPVLVPVDVARELKLVSTDSGDGISCDMANWAEARLLRDPNALRLGNPILLLQGKPAPPPSSEVCGFSLIAEETGPQVATLGNDAFVVSLWDAENVLASLPISNIKEAFTLQAEAIKLEGDPAELILSATGGSSTNAALSREKTLLTLRVDDPAPEQSVTVKVQGSSGRALVRITNVQLITKNRKYDLSLLPAPAMQESYPPSILPAMRPAMERAMLEWDWRMQDGIGTPRETVGYFTAIKRLLIKVDLLRKDLKATGVSLTGLEVTCGWQGLHERLFDLNVTKRPVRETEWESLWRDAHLYRRALVFKNPLADVGPLLFIKRVPASFSHQLTQYYGRSARPGGGIFVLDRPGESMQARELVGSELPPGSYMLPEISYAGDRILFAYCEVDSVPVREHKYDYCDRWYHLYEVKPDGTGLRQITEGPYDDFAPRELPNGKLLFLSTRRGGYHRCGAGPCDVYTLALMENDGSNPRTISYHETQEWDPAVLADGRVIYSRWDYVDRNAVHYQQLWTVRPDGSAPVAYYGNNTFNPVGVWEAQQVPNSPFVMATAAAHHAMTAGSIILLDTTRGVDGLDPITRLTPDAPFPESETYMLPRNWHAPGSPKEYDTPEEQKRWPGHCYRSPYPLSEKYFLAAYSFDPLLGEPIGNKANMFGLYFVDAFGNKELLYRDLNIASQWPVPIRARKRPPIVPSIQDTLLTNEGTFLLQNVYASDPALPKDTPIKALRIVQVLPKTTPNANNPSVGLANASPGKQVLGTVPVEEDGSAYFKAPAGIPLTFQALDEKGQAVQVMRSLTYLQPGENASCVGCHEHRLTAPPQRPKAQAFMRPPSEIKPAPDGAKPLSYPLLVQPVLDKHCMPCHNGEAPEGSDKKNPIVLTGETEGHYTKSYNVLAKRVPFSSWGGLAENFEPGTQPDQFGARASSLMAMLNKGHNKVQLNDEDMDRLTTWMDANALFYGTFDPEDQQRQRNGERIAGPALE